MALTSCCGCFSLKTGTRIIGSLSLISSILSLIIACITIASLDMQFLNNSDPKYDYIKVPLIKGGLAVSVTYFIVAFVLSVMLLIGTNNRKEIFVFPFLCCNIASILFSIPIYIGLICFLAYATSMEIAMVFFVVIGLTFAFNIYLCMVIYHFYHELLCEKFGRKVNPTTGKIFMEPFENDA